MNWKQYVLQLLDYSVQGAATGAFTVVTTGAPIFSKQAAIAAGSGALIALINHYRKRPDTQSAVVTTQTP